MTLAKLLAPQTRRALWHGWEGMVPCRPRLAQPPLVVQTRSAAGLIPPSQYDTPYPKKFRLTYALRVYWELFPLLAVTATSILLVVLATAFACKNKVDVVFSTHSCNNISRTMNLRRPTSHKFIIINQRYEPWPEMQDVIDKMICAEHRAVVKATKCSYEVDVSFDHNGRTAYSRTMDLRNPEICKLVTINQLYQPWPEMQAVLDQMKLAEKRELNRKEACLSKSSLA